MKKTIIFFLSYLALISSAFANFQEITPKFQYDDVTIYSLKSVNLKTTFLPASPMSVAFYKGVLDLELNIEGNFCLGDNETFGLMKKKKSNGVYLTLFAGTKLPIPDNLGCAHQSIPKIAKVSLKIDLPVLRDPIDVNYIIPFGSNNEEIVTINISERNGKLELSY